MASRKLIHSSNNNSNSSSNNNNNNNNNNLTVDHTAAALTPRLNRL